MPEIRRMAAAAARGGVASMAMTGIRAFAGALGLIEETPPEAVLHHGVAGFARRVPPSKRRAAVELSHWGFGAAMAVVFAGLPARLRRPAWSGPLFGAAVWTVFEGVVTPLLGLPRMRHTRTTERAVLLADHLVYGAVIRQPDRPATSTGRPPRSAGTAPAEPRSAGRPATPLRQTPHPQR